MSTSPQMPPWMFNLDGTFVGFLSPTPGQPPYLALDVDHEQLAIGLSATLWESLQRHLTPGERIRCIGRSQLDFQAKTLKLSAYQVFALPSHASL